MCKILSISNVLKVEDTDLLISTARDLIGETERDGFGYAFQTPSKPFGERFVINSGLKIQAPFVDPIHNTFGDLGTEPNGWAIFHGRTSTNQKNLLNTHPIERNGWHLIHNGVVTDHGPKYKMKTTNDTEHLVHHLSTGGIDAIAKYLTGYYAVVAFDPSGIVHVIRDSTAPLYVSFVDELDAYIFGSTENLLRRWAEENDWAYKGATIVKDNSYMRFTGSKLLEYKTFSPRGRTDSETRHSNLSLGYALSPVRSAPSGTIYDASLQGFGGAIDVKTQDKLDESLDLALREFDQIDGSYTVIDESGRRVDLETFRQLGDEDRLELTVIRGDGTIVCPIDYYTDRLYLGNIAD